MAIVLASTVACGIDTEGVAPAIHASRLLQRVTIEYRTYNLSRMQPYDTVTLNARGISGTGATVDAPIKFAYDTQYVDIRENGFLTVKKAVDRTVVTATMSYGGATRVDTTIINVINGSPPVNPRVAIAPNVGDSAKVAYSGVWLTLQKTLRLIREDGNGTPLSMLVTVQSSDIAVASITQSGASLAVAAVRPGRTVFRVSTYAYGVGLQDSLSFIVGWPLFVRVLGQERFVSGSLVPTLGLGGERITVGIGACVIWSNPSADTDMDIIFDDPTHVAPSDSAFSEGGMMCKLFSSQDTTAGVLNRGNVAPWHVTEFFAPGVPNVFTASRGRAFPKAGVYTYHSARHGYTGTIVVCDESHDTSCAPENYKWGEVAQ